MGLEIFGDLPTWSDACRFWLGLVEPLQALGQLARAAIQLRELALPLRRRQAGLLRGTAAATLGDDGGNFFLCWQRP
jgi:hypothetical protein